RPLGGMTFSAVCGRVRAQLTPVDYPSTDPRYRQSAGHGLWLVVIAPAPKGLLGCERLLRKPSLAPPSSSGPISVATDTGHGLFDERFHCIEQGDVRLERMACDALVSLNERYALVSLS